ncbi:MAG: acyl-CoA dehydrogenase [Desulfobacterales bacterium]|nr:acyl-CoA dehydrogenase [Desulfobacterales bacterium]
MNYDFSEKEQAFISGIEDALTGCVEKRGSQYQDLAVVDKDLRQTLQQLEASGYTRMGCGADNGGTQLLMVAMEKVAATAPSLFLGIEMSCRMFGRLLGTWASSPALKDDVFPQVVEGRTVGAVALSEAAMNTENQPLETSGTRDGQQIIVNGTKSFVVNGPLADWIAVAGQFEEKVALFIIARDTPGLTLGERLATSGYEGAAICGLALEACRIPETQVITGLDSRKMLSRLRLWENQIMMGASLGALKAAFETARDFAKTHKTGGKPAIAYQAVAFKLSEMMTLYQTAQLFAYRAAWTYDAQPKEAESLTWCAKVFCTEAAEKVASSAMQVLSGEGLLAGNPAERAYRNAKLGQVCGTSTEIARVKIGDQVLGYK